MRLRVVYEDTDHMLLCPCVDVMGGQQLGTNNTEVKYRQKQAFIIYLGQTPRRIKEETQRFPSVRQKYILTGQKKRAKTSVLDLSNIICKYCVYCIKNIQEI